MLDPSALMMTLVTFVVAFATTCITIPGLASWFKRRGIVGIDVHKLKKPEIPEMCGLAIIAGITAAGLLSSALPGADRKDITAFLGTVLIAGTIGAIDDLKPLSSVLKPVLTALAAVPILLLGAYDPHPVFPLIGTLRLTILYPLLIPFAIAIPANAANMLDVFNGSMSGTLAIVSLALGLILALSGKTTPIILVFALVGGLLAFYLFNRYPARIFSGDTGSLAAGAAIGALSVIGRIEAFTIVALTPFIMNAFYGLASIGRLYERHEIKSRPVRLREDGFLEATRDQNAPVTLTRLILAEGPLREQDVVFVMLALTALSSALAVLAYFLPQVM